MKRPGPFGSRQQPAEPEDDPALVLARDLDRRDQEQHDRKRTTTASDDQRGSHASILCTVERQAVERVDPRARSPGRSGSSERARQSSPRTNTWPPLAHDALHADDLLRADRRPGCRRTAPPSRCANAQKPPSTAVIASRPAGPRCGTARRVVEERASPTAIATSPESVSAPCVVTCASIDEQRDAEQHERQPAHESGSTEKPKSAQEHADARRARPGARRRGGRSRSRARRCRRGRAARRCSGRSASRGTASGSPGFESVDLRAGRVQREGRAAPSL